MSSKISSMVNYSTIDYRKNTMIPMTSQEKQRRKKIWNAKYYHKNKEWLKLVKILEKEKAELCIK